MAHLQQATIYRWNEATVVCEGQQLSCRGCYPWTSQPHTIRTGLFYLFPPLVISETMGKVTEIVKDRSDTTN
jgi:hypothetical protein